MKFWLFFLKIFVISALLIISNSNLPMYDAQSRAIFVDRYVVWLSGIFDQGVYITGYVVNADWLPANPGENKTLVLPHR